MPLNVQEACKFLDLFLNDREAWNTTKKSLIGAGITAISAFVGALFLGPPGFAIGGTLGGLTSYACYYDDFRPIMEVWNSMSQEQRTEIAEHFNRAFQFELTDALLLMRLLKGDPALADKVKNFVCENMLIMYCTSSSVTVLTQELHIYIDTFAKHIKEVDLVTTPFFSPMRYDVERS